MGEWEHLFVTARAHAGTLRPWQVNGQELPGWEKISIADYISQIAEQGWELSGVAISDLDSDNIKRLIFKRPKV
jgi:hypothetical protein